MFQVSPEHLMTAAVHATGHGEDMAAGHLAADQRIESARYGWVDISAAALDAKMADWLQKSKALLVSIGNHAYQLQEAAIKHAAAEARRAETLARVYGGGGVGKE